MHFVSLENASLNELVLLLSSEKYKHTALIITKVIKKKSPNSLQNGLEPKSPVFSIPALNTKHTFFLYMNNCSSLFILVFLAC